LKTYNSGFPAFFLTLFFLCGTGHFDSLICRESLEDGNSQAEHYNEVVSDTLLIKKIEKSEIETMTFDQAIVKFCKHEEKIDKCLCKAATFRIAQLCCSCTGDSVFRSYEIKKITTGWNADGPRGLFTKKLGVPKERFIIPEDSTNTNDLTLKDSWFEIEYKNGMKLKFRGTDRIYTDQYLVLRSRHKKGDESIEEIFHVEKLKVEHNLRELPFKDKFILIEQ
jgi:hypothetical protein